MTSEKRQLLRQIVQFGLVGTFNTGVSYATYAISVYLGAHYVVASMLGYVISVFSAWLFQYFIVFREGGVQSSLPWWRSLIKTYIAYASTGLVLNNLLLVLMLELLHIEVLFQPLFVMDEFFMFDTAQSMAKYLAPFFAMVVSIPLNFILNKFWAYREKK